MSITREEYEKTPPCSDEYTGPRYKYGFRNRPYSFATCPKGAILQTYKPEDKEHGSRHGTIEYPFPLTGREITGYELIDFEAIKTQDNEFQSIRLQYSEELRKRAFTINYSSSDYLLAEVTKPNVGTIQTKLFTDDARYCVAVKNEKMGSFSDLDIKTPAELSQRITQVLQWLDKELAKAQELTKPRQPAPYPPPRAEKLNTWAKPDEECIIIHTGPVPSQGEIVARVYSNGSEAKRFAASKDLENALHECHRVIQAHLADQQTLAGREGTKAMNMAREALTAADSQTTTHTKSKRRSSGMER